MPMIKQQECLHSDVIEEAVDYISLNSPQMQINSFMYVFSNLHSTSRVLDIERNHSFGSKEEKNSVAQCTTE